MLSPMPLPFVSRRAVAHATALGSAVVLASGAARAQADSAAVARLRTQLRATDTAAVAVVRTRDGSTLVGRVVRVTDDSVRLRGTGGETQLALAAVASLRTAPASAVRPDGTVWFPNPNPTRLLFAPTAFALPRGQGYFSDYYIVLPGIAYGVTDRVSIGGGVSLIPGAGSQQLLYFTPKVQVARREGAALAVGGLFAAIPNFGLDDDGRRDTKSFGLLYGVGTVGSADNNATLGVGFGYVGRTFSSRPAVMLGGQTRVTRRVALVSENYFVPGAYDGALVSYGVRLMGEQLAFDLGFFNLTSGLIFPGVPYVGAVVNFR